MSKLDQNGSNDPSMSESEPVSEVDSEEMAKLMADIDGIGLDTSSKKKKETTVPLPVDGKKSEPEGTKIKSEGAIKSDPKTKSEILSPKTLDQSTTINSAKSPLISQPSRGSKKQLLSDLFEGNSEGGGEKKLPHETSKKKTKEVSFDDDSHDLLEEVSQPLKKSSGGFLDSLLGGSPSRGAVKKKTAEEFVLPDKYKSSSPSREVDSMEDFFSSNSAPRRGRRTSSTPKKNFNFDDDDILGPSKDRKTSKADDYLFGGSSKATTESSSSQSPQLKKTSTSLPPKDEWQMPPKASPLKVPPSDQIPITTASSLSQEWSPAAMQQSQPPQKNNQANTNLSSLSSAMLVQQQEAEANLLHQFQLQLHEQKQKLVQQMMTQNSFQSLPLKPGEIEDEETIKKLKIELHKATTSSGSLEAELELCRKQHQQEINNLEEANRKKLDMEREVWRRTEVRMEEERIRIEETHKTKMKEMEKERSALISTYEASLASLRSEWTENLGRTKEMYGGVTERMKTEHQNAIQRLTELKNLELRAAVSASTKAKEADTVFQLLETNTANLTQLTSSIHERSESAFDLTKNALQLKEKQLKEIEAQMTSSRAEAESERNRLTVLVSRLESNMANQGTEVETEKWKLAQEKMKFDVERKVFAEERKMFQIRAENERRELKDCREVMWAEQREMVQAVVQERAALTALQTTISHKNQNCSEAEQSVNHLQEERRVLEERVSSLKLRREELLREELRVQEKEQGLLKQKEQLMVSKELMERSKEELTDQRSTLESKESKMEDLRRENQRQLSEITRETQNIFLKEQQLKKLQSRVHQEEQEAMSFMERGLCPACKGAAALRNSSSARPPADDSEKTLPPFVGWTNKRLEPASVLERLQKARQEETDARARHHQIIARLNQ